MGHMYPSATLALSSGAVSWISDTIGALLVSPGYVFNPAHVHVSDLVAFELNDVSYGRQTLTGKTQTLDTVNNQTILSSALVVFPLLANSITNALILFKSTGTDSTSPLLAYVDFFSTITAIGKTVQVNPSASGWMQCQAQ